MIRLHILILSALPICLSQFSIQGPSDGNRAAQSLRYSEEKGIEYSDQRDSQGTGDFSIQGATDGNSNFHIQGASDGNADFQIQGASDGNSDFQIQGATDGNSDFKIQGATDGNANFHIQGATDSNYQSSIQGPYDANQGGQRSLQYNDPNGFKLNWRSYAHGHLSPQPQQQQQYQPEPAYTRSQTEPQYAPQPAPRPAPRPAPQQPPRPAPQPAPQPTHQSEPRVPAQQPINYRPFDNAPAQIKQLLQFQLQIPYLNAIPEHLRYDSLQATAQSRAQPQHDQPQHDQPPQDAPQRASPPPQYRQRPRGHQRSKRQAQPHQGQQQQQPQQPQQQYRRIPQPAPETLPQYSTSVPSNIKQLLQFQSQIPYLSVVPEKFRYNLESPPDPVQPYRSPGIQQNAPRSSHQRTKRQAHQQQRQNHQQQQPQPQQYKRIPQPAPEVLPQYSTNVPSQIKQLLQFQSQIPYVNAIPEQFRYNLENVPAQAQSHSSQRAPQNTAGGGHQRGKRQTQQHRQPQQPQQQPQQQYRRIPQPAPETQPQYSANVPSQIKQLLQFQSQIPYVNAIPEQFRYNLENVQQSPPQSRGHSRSKREAQGEHQGQLQQQYRRIPQPALEEQPQYSTNLPSGIQQILNFQAQAPYDIIANRIIYRPDKPYVPQPVSAPASNYPANPAYQGRGQGDIRPVTEHQ